jgi:hypothetical protein
MRTHGDLAVRLRDVVRRSPAVMTVLRVMREQRLPDALLFSGAVYQTVWNELTGRSCDYGVKDYDVGYFDPDTSFEAEGCVIARVAAALDEPLRERVEVRNQARVHLWFPNKFGHPYPPLRGTAQALERFVCPAFAVGVRLADDTDDVVVAAPFGLDDVFDMCLRVNTRRGRAADWSRIIDSALVRWPELTVDSRLP